MLWASPLAKLYIGRAFEGFSSKAMSLCARALNASDVLQANQILGLAPGEVFVQRNVGNLATHKDFNCMTCLDYAINNLKGKHVIICGHYNCGAVKGASSMPDKSPGLVNLWISDIKATRNRHAAELSKLEGDKQVNRSEASFSNPRRA